MKSHLHIPVKFIALITLGLLCSACPKRPVPEPTVDTEFQSAVDVTYALMAVADIDQVMAYVCEGREQGKGFFWEAPGSASDRKVTVSNNGGQVVHVSFNRVLSRDGHTRNGTLRISYNSEADANKDYYRDYGFAARVEFIDFQVDAFSVTARAPLEVHNLAPAFNWDPKTTPLGWKLIGDLDFKHLSDVRQNMHLKFDVKKTLANTSDPKVYTGRETAIQWENAQLEYSGQVQGETAGQVPFQLTIVASRPLQRNMQCSPEQAQSLGASSQPRSQYQDLHPFVNGTAEFITGARYPRQIYFGSEDGALAPCDNAGILQIKGISYPIDFRRDYR